MGKRSAAWGFTLIELMIVIAIVAIIAAVALPSLLRSRITANETSAIATIRSIASCQEQFRMEYGRYAFVQELATYDYLELPLVGGGPTPDPNYPWYELDPVKSGYYFGSHADPPLPDDVPIEDELAGLEVGYFAYGDPVIFRETGVRSFFVDCSGVIRGGINPELLQTEDPNVYMPQTGEEMMQLVRSWPPIE